MDGPYTSCRMSISRDKAYEIEKYRIKERMCFYEFRFYLLQSYKNLLRKNSIEKLSDFIKGLGLPATLRDAEDILNIWKETY